MIDHVYGSPTLSMPLPIKCHLREEFDTFIHMGLKRIPLECELYKGKDIFLSILFTGTFQAPRQDLAHNTQ